MFKNNKAIKFIVIFVISYLLLNGLYQFLLWAYNPQVDLFTHYTTTSLCTISNDFSYVPSHYQIGYVLSYKQQKVINITEGCNAIAIVITLLSFCIAYTSKIKNYLLFIPIALCLVYIMNQLRIYWLVLIKVHYPNFFSFFHVYIFPAILYLVAFGLMVIWIKFFVDKEPKEN